MAVKKKKVSKAIVDAVVSDIKNEASRARAASGELPPTRQAWATDLTNREGLKKSITVAQVAEVVRLISEDYSRDPVHFGRLLEGKAKPTAPDNDGSVAKPKPGGS